MNAEFSKDWGQWQNQSIDGVFPLRRLLGCSHHKAVFLTEHKAKKLADAAVKLVRADALQAKALLAQWSAAAQLAHPHLVRLFEMGRFRAGEHEFVFVVMEYAEQSLAQILRRRALSHEEVRELLFPTLDALTFLHRRHLIHGGLDPSNLLAVDDQLKLASDTLRPAGKDIGTADDVWSLGATLVEALTQRRPSKSDPPLELNLPSNVPTGLADTMRRCLSPTPADRPTVIDLRSEYKPAPSAASLPNPAPPTRVVPPTPTQIAASSKAHPQPAAVSKGHPQAPAASQPKPQALAASQSLSQPTAVSNAEPKKLASSQPQPQGFSAPRFQTQQADISKPQPHMPAVSQPQALSQPHRTQAPASSHALQAAVGTFSQTQPAVVTTSQAQPAAVTKSHVQPTAVTKSQAPPTVVATSQLAQASVVSHRQPQPPDVSHESTTRSHSRRRPLLLAIAAMAILIAAWFGLRSTSGPEADLPAPVVSVPPTVPAPAVPSPVAKPPAAESSQTRDVSSAPSPPPVQAEPASSAVLHEVTPEVPDKIRQDIQGRIYVTVRVLVDPSGAVTGALIENPGPSKYFARLADNAAREWQFVPADDDSVRVWLVTFLFTRDGVTTRATEQ